MLFTVISLCFVRHTPSRPIMFITTNNMCINTVFCYSVTLYATLHMLNISGLAINRQVDQVHIAPSGLFLSEMLN